MSSLGRSGTLLSKAVSMVVIICTALIPSGPALATFGDGTPTVRNPSVFSSTPEAPKVDEQMGAFTESIPLDIPPGRKGLQPDLSLQYNSQNTSDNIVGYGWSLSIPYIQRLNKTGSQNLYATSSYFTSSMDGELTSQATSSTSTTSPTILDTLPVTYQTASNVTSDSFTYTVPSGGTNKELIIQFCLGGGRTPTASQNGVNIPLTQISGNITRCYHWYGTLANPSSGTFSISWTGGAGAIQISLMTLQNVDQSNPIDVSNVTDESGTVSSISTSATTTQGNDLLLDEVVGSQTTTQTYGAGQTETHPHGASDPQGEDTGSYKAAASTAGGETMTRNFSPNDDNDDLALIAVRGASAVQTPVTSVYAARVDNGSANSYSFSGNTWTVYDKNGTRYLFGSDDTGRQYDSSSATSSHTYKWMLQEIRDTNDNYVTFTYLRESNELYPYQILYSGHGTTDGIFKLAFATSTRPDVRINYAPGFKVTTNSRISEIDALINGATVRKYLLGYGPGINGKRSLLTSFQQQGYDENSTLTSLPAMKFTYSSSTSQFYGPSASTHEVNGQSWQIADSNGNGMNDTNKFYFDSATSSSMYVDQTSSVTTAVPPEYWASSTAPTERGVRYVDVNADGKADVVRGWRDDVHGTSLYSLYLNSYSTSTNSYSWTATTTIVETTPVFAFNETSKIITGGIFGDVNGDGLPDFETALPGYQTVTLLGNGLGWDVVTNYFSPVQNFPTATSTATSTQFADLNGDSLDDWIYSDGTSTFAVLNTGTGWESSTSTQWTIATSTLYRASDSNYYDRGMRFFDLNGDGLPDFIRSYKVAPYTACGGVPSFETADVKVVLLNTGNGWATSTLYALPAYITKGNVPGVGCWDGSFDYNEYGNWIGNGQQSQDVLTTVTSAKGGSTSVIYKNSTQLAGKNPELPYSLLVVTEMGTYDGMGNAATTTFSYSGGKQYSAQGVRNRKFAGFASTTISAPDSTTYTYFSQGVGVNTSLGEQADGNGQIDHPFRKDIYNTAGNLLQRIFYRWDSFLNTQSTFVGLGRQIMQNFTGNGTHQDSATDYLYASSTGDLIKLTQYGEVIGGSDGTFTDTGTDKRTTNITYAASSSVNLSVPIQKTILDSNSATSSDEKLYYDNQTFGSVTKGNVTKNESWISGVTYASSTKTYNSYGLVASSTDRRGKLTSNIFDAYNLYVASSTNPLSQQTQYSYDYSVGKVKQTTDPNNRLARNLYDGVGRIRETDQSDISSPTIFATTTAYQYTDNSTPPSSVHRADYLTSTSTVDSYSYFDGLGRTLQERKASQYANVFSATDRVYNLVGKLASSSVPYFSSGSSATSRSSDSLLYTNFTYDGLQRLLNATNAVGTTANLYSKWTTTVTDANGNTKDYVRDGYGNLINVVEHGPTTATTTYTYDALNNLATTTDARSNIRHFTYDGLSRRLTAQDLHYATDTDFGTWVYTYDDSNNVTSETDAKGQVINRTYDGLNRLLTEDYTGQAGTEVSNIYDTCTYGIGRICTASSTSASSTITYDILGRTATNTVTVFGIPFSMGYGYDLQGNVATLNYPNSTQMYYTYNLAGLPSHIARKLSGTSSFTDVVTSIDYSPTGQVVNTLFANGASSTRAYDPDALYRLLSIRTTAASSSLIQNFTYAYDPIGNITQLGNTASTSAYAITNFSYDQLYRLIIASTTAATTIAPATTTIAIADTLPVSYRNIASVTSDAFTYNVPLGGENKLLVVQLCLGGGRTPTATQNGVSVPLTEISGSIDRCHHWYGTLANPSSGTFFISWTGDPGGVQYSVMTLVNAAQTNPIDASNVTDVTSSSASISTSVTTTQGHDLILDEVMGAANTTQTYGTGQTEDHPKGTVDPNVYETGTYRHGGSSSGTETMTRNFSPNETSADLAVIAVKEQVGNSIAGPIPTTYRQVFSHDELGNLISLLNGATSSVSSFPSIMDSIPVTYRNIASVTSDSFTYTVPSGGSNKLLVVQFCLGGGRTPTATQNGVGVPLTEISGNITRCHHWYGTLASPSTGTFSISWTGGASGIQLSLMTLQNAAQSSSVDVSNVTDLTSSGSTISTSVTTTQGNDLLLDEVVGSLVTTHTYGTGQIEDHPKGSTDPQGEDTGSYKLAASSAGTETMTRNFSPNDDNDDLAVVAIKSAGAVIGGQVGTTTWYVYGGTGYANPDAVTQITDCASIEPKNVQGYALFLHMISPKRHCRRYR